MQQPKDVLKKLGFTESEVNVYVASLELGPKPVQEIAKKVGVSRTTAYAVIESLLLRGLMSSLVKEKRTLYAAEAPDRLVTYQQGQMRKMEEALGDIRGIVPSLKLLQSGDKPIVKMFEGREALKAIQEDMVQSKPKYLDEFLNRDNLDNLYSLDQDLIETIQALEKFQTKRRSIYISDIDSRSINEKEFPLMKIIRLNKKEYNFDGDILVYGNKVALSTLKGKQISVLIESEEIAKTVKSFFDLVWNKNSSSD